MKSKVTEFVVEPLNEWFTKPLTAGQATVYEVVLYKYPPEILKQAILQLKSTWTSKSVPLPANVREICDNLTPRVKPLTLFEKTRLSFWEAAAQIMPTEIGRLALRECWARSLICSYMETGKTEYSEQEIERFRQGKRKVVEIARTLESDNPRDKDVLSFWHTLHQREQEIIDKYKHLITGDDDAMFT